MTSTTIAMSPIDIYTIAVLFSYCKIKKMKIKRIFKEFPSGTYW